MLTGPKEIGKTTLAWGLLERDWSNFSVDLKAKYKVKDIRKHLVRQAEEYVEKNKAVTQGSFAPTLKGM